MTATARRDTAGLSTAGPAGRGRRLDFLDALRGVAVGLVLLQHVGELVFPAVRRLTESGLQLGQLGVMLFFLCSGFIIPASLERTTGDPGRLTAVRRFWRNRFFRLYPLYWLSLAGAMLLTAAGTTTSTEGLSPLDWLLNVSMLQGMIGAPHALGLYWTLTFELVFYAAMSALLLAGWHRRSVALSVTLSGLCVLLAVLAEPVLGRPAPLSVFCLTTMFTGTVFFRWHRGDVRLRTLSWCVLTAAAAGTFLLISSLSGNEQPELGGTRSLVPMLAAWLGAYALFCAGVALRHRQVPWALRRLGTLSYSIYLLQPLVLLAVPALPGPGLLSAVLWVGLTLVASSLSHRFLELPAVRLGRRAPRARPELPGGVIAPLRRPELRSGTGAASARELEVAASR